MYYFPHSLNYLSGVKHVEHDRDTLQYQIQLTPNLTFPLATH